MGDVMSGVRERVANRWDREPISITGQLIFSTAWAINWLVSQAAQRAVQTPTDLLDAKLFAVDLVRAVDRLQVANDMATGILYVQKVAARNEASARKWAERHMAEAAKNQRRVERLVRVMVIDGPPDNCEAAAKLARIIATAAWADPCMFAHDCHLMTVVNSQGAREALGNSVAECPTPNEIDSLPARI